MAVIHKTTMKPTKLELLTPWLPLQPWYLGAGRDPELSRVGGFRLDDPRGEVGIEFMVVRDDSGERPVHYHLPLSYRGAPLDGAEQGLIGTSEHGVLGQRWIYDGAHDPVLVAQLLALLQGRAAAQMQSESDTPDPSVTVDRAEAIPAGSSGAPEVTDGPDITNGSDGTRLAVGPLTLDVTRVLRPGEDGRAAAALAHVSAGWRLPDGGEARGRFAVLSDAVSRAS
ncbi:maltokinase N-terminal cap-like domain-containing protein [Streptomyces botrytidirepellens]|uniref:1,4-alpha-glucan branching protein n=1 Tax=Streptomyces botrytidirepellens TaxID=2486417 RepID=A0A3M8THW3_9ACTN|nr:1,4-alpha-glucan branching protein [Streptomyces botrytidirepellens]RNF92703.1 1,4-alpha-glucan branching protein [Streptomyces botrytidirepellens]